MCTSKRPLFTNVLTLTQGFLPRFWSQIHGLFKDFQGPHLRHSRRTTLTHRSIFISTSTQVQFTAFKLLGVRVSSDLKWTTHVDTIIANAAPSLHFLKQLKWAGTPLHFYTATVWQVLEYACPVWNTGFTVAQSSMLEAVQKRTIRTIYSDANYEASLIVAFIDIVWDRSEVPLARFIKRQILASSSLVHYLLPDRLDTLLTWWLSIIIAFTDSYLYIWCFWRLFLITCLVLGSHTLCVKLSNRSISGLFLFAARVLDCTVKINKELIKYKICTKCEIQKKYDSGLIRVQRLHVAVQTIR